MKITPPVRLAGFVLFTALAFAPVARACTCVDPPSFDQTFATSTVVFKGVVEAVDPPDPGLPDYVRVTLHPTGVWKGAPPAHVHVWTGTLEGTCGLPFQVG